MDESKSFQDYLKIALKDIELTTPAESEEEIPYDIHEEIREMLVQARVQADMTQKQLSEQSGISQANISRIENGKMHPSLDVLKKLADALGKRLSVTFESLEVNE